MAAVRLGGGPKAGRVLREQRVARHQNPVGPCSDRLETEPVTRLIRAGSGSPASRREIAATMGILFSNPQPALPPESFPSGIEVGAMAWLVSPYRLTWPGRVRAERAGMLRPLWRRSRDAPLVGKSCLAASIEHPRSGATGVFQAGFGLAFCAFANQTRFAILHFQAQWTTEGHRW